MNYRDFFKNKKATAKDIQSLIPEGVDPKEFQKGIGTEKEHTDDEFMAAKIAGDHLKEDPKYYTKLSDAGLEEEDVEECGDCGCGDPSDDHSGEYDDNGGLPTLGGALAVPHRGQPIMMGKIIQVGGIGGGPANGALSGMTNAGGKDKGVPATQPGDKEPLTAGGKAADSSVASKSVGGNIVAGEGQEQGGPNSSGTIAGTSKLNESKEKVRRIVKNVLKEVRYDRESGKWVRIDEGGHKAGCKCAFCSNKGGFGKKKDKEEKEDVDENTVNMKMGPSYKTVQPRMYKVQDDDHARTNQYTPEISEMYDDEEECMMNERYVELANAQRNLKESELAELKVLREKIDKIAISKRNYGLSVGGTEPSLFEDDNGTMKMGPSYKVVQPRMYKVQRDNHPRTNQFDPQVSETVDAPTGGHKGQAGTRLWKCGKCGHELVAASTERKPDPIRWTDGHVCNFIPADEGEGVGAEPVGIGEAGIGAVQHSSYRTAKHGNMKQDPKQRWADDLDEGSKKPSKVAKTIAKGQKPAKTQKDNKLKFKAAKKTTSGVHKRKT